MSVKFLYMAGRCRSGGDKVGNVVHVVAGENSGYGPAICGARPGLRGNGWSVNDQPAPTCPKCIEIAAATAPVETPLGEVLDGHGDEVES